MDESDMATQSEELHLQAALSPRYPILHKTGSCWECDEITEGVFCCFECGETYEKRQKFKKGMK